MDGSTCGKAGVSFPKAQADKGGKLVNSGSTVSSTDSGGSDCTTLSGEGSGEGVLSTQAGRGAWLGCLQGCTSQAAMLE
jgi:hypothetical protein